MSIIYNRFNFHKHTFCVFQEVAINAIANLTLAYKSKSGSCYYFTEEGVFRVANHWGRAANCRWRLYSEELNVNQKERIGFAKWTDFYPNNEHEKLYYVAVNWITNEVTFEHKDNPTYDGVAKLRTAAATAKVIQQIKEVLVEENWAKHLQFDDLAQLRKEIVTELQSTNTTLVTIKRNYL